MTDNQDSNIKAGVQTPPTDRPLTAGDVTLKATITYPGSRMSDILIGGWKVQISNGCLQTAMTARPATSAASEVVDSSHGSVYDRLLTLIHDRDEALRGDGQTDPSEIDETVLEIMKITAALASPPVSERERELEGALRLAATAIGCLTFDDEIRSVIGNTNFEILKANAAEIRRLTAQPAGEPTHG